MRKAIRSSRPPADKINISIRRNIWGQGRSLTMTRLTAGIISLTLILMILMAGYFTYNYLLLSYDRAHIADIKQRNQQQQQQVEAMKSQLKELQQHQQKVTEEQNKLKKIMGINPERPLSKAVPSRGGQGGGEIENADKLLPDDFAATAGEVEEELFINGWESAALLKMWQDNPGRYLAIPSEYPVAVAELTSDFGSRKNPFRGKRSEEHHGLDFSGDVGTDVFAAGKGKVIFAGWDSGYGRLIKIDHGNGLISWYGHNYRMLVKKGDQVERGEQIALMGSSGRSTGPHVHFAIEKDGEFISPWYYLP